MGLPAQPHQSLIDGLAVLQTLAVKKEPVSCSSLAAELGQEVTRINRMLKTLSHLGLAHQTKSRLYTNGPGMHVLAAQSMFGSGLIRKSIPVLESLSKLGHVVALGVLWRDQVTYLYHWTPGISSGEALGRIALYPAERSSIGVCLLAGKTDVEIRKLFSERPEMLDTLLPEIRRSRENGFSILETAPGVFSLARPIGDPAYVALALSGKIPKKEIPKIGELLRTKAEIIEEEIHSPN